MLNNWEATHCDFDEDRLKQLFDGARQVGTELFLLDDGWFGNGSYSRDDDKHGLGDWDPSIKKLPKGLSYIAKEALKRKDSLRFKIQEITFPGLLTKNY